MKLPGTAASKRIKNQGRQQKLKSRQEIRKTPNAPYTVALSSSPSMTLLTGGFRSVYCIILHISEGDYLIHQAQQYNYKN
ncbi:MAG: hypothetical protein NWF00_10185 [Candidatus Bathyarchaeota archaeon]|nr:hypothetical protein [Candidatus Bathyarchaeota archaeon]